jgi:carbon catabolite-derepressing protein kinase
MTQLEGQKGLAVLSDEPSAKLEKKSEKKKYSDFQVVSKICESSYPVYVAYSKSERTFLALKIFPYKENKISTGFMNEVRFLDFSHPHVIKFHDAVHEKKTVQSGKYFKTSYILMELAPYGDFLGLLNPDRLPYDERLARTYFHQLVSGIEYLHQKGYAHMDLKLENILIGEHFQLKITDFNLTCKKEDLDLCTEGTVNYRAPEVIDGRCKDLFAADVYSAGVLLFCFKSHLYPYLEKPSKDEIDFFTMILNKDKEFWVQHPKSVDDPLFFDKNFKELFVSMTEKNPSKRATLEEVKKTKWFRGPVYSQQELAAVMRRHIQPKTYR